jgi:ABC-type phosphate transport system substrate-binding protein
MKSTFKRGIAATLPAVLLAGTALAAGAAAPTVLGGGATLPIPAYLGLSESSGATNFGKAGSVFGYFATQSSGLNVEYCATGSGKGKDIFGGPGVISGVTYYVQDPCANAANSKATSYGFEPASRSPLPTHPALAGTDAPLTQADYNFYITDNPGSTIEPVELPSIFGSIAIAYHLSGLSGRITLTDAQICGVYNGSITKWGTLLGNSNATAIIPVYRSDGSGTSFNFSNHLATVCSGFNGNQTFTLADPKLPADAVGASGNAGIVAEVNSANGSFGYIEAGYISTLSGSGVNYADVKNGKNGTVYDPITGLPTSAALITAGELVKDYQVVQGTGPATLQKLTNVRSPNCVVVVPPADYANPSSGYSIVAVTYLLFNSSGNGTSGATDLHTLVTDLDTPGNFKGGLNHITTVDEAGKPGTTGYSSVSSTFASILTPTASSCIKQ